MHNVLSAAALLASRKQQERAAGADELARTSLTLCDVGRGSSNRNLVGVLGGGAWRGWPSAARALRAAGVGLTGVESHGIQP